jgi:hypothetical protein
MTTKLKFRSTDAALIFRRNGIVEVLVPRDDETATNVFISRALFWASNDPTMMKTITGAFVHAVEADRPVH